MKKRLYLIALGLFLGAMSCLKADDVDNLAAGLKEVAAAQPNLGGGNLLPPPPPPIPPMGGGNKPNKPLQPIEPIGGKENVKPIEGKLLTPGIEEALGFFDLFDYIKQDVPNLTGKFSDAVGNLIASKKAKDDKFKTFNKDILSAFERELKDLKSVKAAQDWYQKLAALYQAVGAFVASLQETKYQDAWNTLTPTQKNKIIFSGRWPDKTFNTDLTRNFLKAVDDNKLDEFVKAIGGGKKPLGGDQGGNVVVTKVGCEKEKQFLKEHGKEYADLIKDVINNKFIMYRTKQKDFLYDMGDINKYKQKKGISEGYNAATVAQSGYVTYEVGEGKLKKSDPEKLKAFRKQLAEFLAYLGQQNFTSEGDINALKADLYLILMYDKSLFNQILLLIQKYKFDLYEFFKDFYKLAIAQIQVLVGEIKQKGAEDLAQDKKEDLDTALDFYNKIKPYVDSAAKNSGPYGLPDSNPQKAIDKKFVTDINGLSVYLMALLCQAKDKLEELGIDYDLIQNLTADETNRLLCGWKVHSLDEIIDAPWDHYITYKEGDISFKFHGYNGDMIMKASVNDKGQPIELEQSKWKLVDKSKSYYRRFYVVFQEIAELIKAYENYKGKFKAVQDARIALLLYKLDDFVYYLKVACGKADCTKDLCSSCFRWDLNGTSGDHGMGFKLANGDYDTEKINRISKEVDDALVRAGYFLTKIREQNPSDRIAKALKQVEAVQAFKKAGGCHGVKNWGEI